MIRYGLERPNEHPPGALWGTIWQSVPRDITRRLESGGCALEVGCRSGLGCLALAEAIPRARVRGHDPDATAIARAHALALIAGLEARVEFAVDDSSALPRSSFDLIITEALHRRAADPRRLLNAMRNALVPEGACLLLEPLHLRRPVTELEQLALQAGFSRCRVLPSEGASRLYELRR